MGRRIRLGGELSRAVIYALGGGFGHVVRAATVARQLAEVGGRATVLVPAGRGDVATRMGVEAIELQPTSSASKLRGSLDVVLDEISPDELIVDCFPSGIIGELDPLPGVERCTLLLRLHRGDAVLVLVSMLFLLAVRSVPPPFVCAGRQPLPE